MTISFDNAPLVELIVELRWGPASVFPPQLQAGVALQGFFSAGDPNRLEEFYMRFGGECYAKGLQRTERLTPAGFPQLPGQAAVRYKSGEPKANKLLQVGPGVFTANAIPPYEGWELFLPYLNSGFESLIAARDDSEKRENFHTITVRYINAFGKYYLEKFTQVEMLKELGFKIQLPEAIQGQLVEDAQSVSVLNVSSKTQDGGRVTLTAGSGQTGNDKAVLFDLAMSYEGVAIDQVIQKVTDAHNMLEEIFVKSTKPLHGLMGVREY
ncbi:TIGR04255 family protein [Pseudomonas sp.]|uniref:TIGR04255 family protein n=1 Tax=Pseudomonas sp. TaxID=306 RepID=UPI003D13DB14